MPVTAPIAANAVAASVIGPTGFVVVVGWGSAGRRGCPAASGSVSSGAIGTSVVVVSIVEVVEVVVVRIGLTVGLVVVGTAE